MNPPSKNIDLICFSHLRWNFVYQRPQHLMSRFAKEQRVFFFEEPVYDAPSQYNEIYEDPVSKVYVVTPHITSSVTDANESLRHLLKLFMSAMQIDNFIAWYYTPLALAFTDDLKPALTVYDCMDELSMFKFASPAIKEWEAELFKRADLVFTGGVHLYEAKKSSHKRIYPFPSGIDIDHFMEARDIMKDPVDQASIPKPRIGFYGVIDERFNIDLLEDVADRRKDWHFVIVGPVVKIDPITLPKNPNIHFTGIKDYKELPAYLSGWNVAMMPFALNDSTKYISPTKTPEFLAAGRPVVSTSIHDVVNPYGKKNFVRIADTPDEFIKAIEELLKFEKQEWIKEVDAFLSTQSWDDIWKRMNDLMNQVLQEKNIINEKKSQAYV